jgi:hypothetical protein
MIDVVTPGREQFTGWLDADGAEVLDRCFVTIDGHAACVEQWRIEGNEGESVVMKPGDVPGRDESGFLDWLRERWSIGADALVSKERGFLAVHHRFRIVETRSNVSEAMPALPHE